jgi:ribosomal protein S18 acetylase RimI-like enzyme
MNYVFEKAKQANISKVWLGVWENNDKAIGLYKTIGFQFLEVKIFYSRI